MAIIEKIMLITSLRSQSSSLNSNNTFCNIHIVSIVFAIALKHTYFILNDLDFHREGCYTVKNNSSSQPG